MKTKEKIYAVIAVILLCVAFYYAGESDYVDEKITEMKNNGSYDRLYNPALTDSQMVEIYDKEGRQ